MFLCCFKSDIQKNTKKVGRYFVVLTIFFYGILVLHCKVRHTINSLKDEEKVYTSLNISAYFRKICQ